MRAKRAQNKNAQTRTRQLGHAYKLRPFTTQHIDGTTNAQLNRCASPTHAELSSEQGHTIIFAPVSASIFLSVLPRGPMRMPIKLMSGCCSCGISMRSYKRGKDMY